MLVVGPDVRLDVCARASRENVGVCVYFDDDDCAPAKTPRDAGAIPFMKIPRHASDLARHVASLAILADRRSSAVAGGDLEIPPVARI